MYKSALGCFVNGAERLVSEHGDLADQYLRKASVCSLSACALSMMHASAHPRVISCCMGLNYQWLLYGAQLPVAVVWGSTTSGCCMGLNYQWLLYGAQLPVAVVWGSTTSGCCMGLNYQWLLYGAQLPVAVVWGSTTSGCCMGLNYQWLLYGAQLPVAVHVQAFKLTTVRHQELLRQAQLEQVCAHRDCQKHE